MSTIANIVIIARTADWLYEHAVLAPEHARKPELQWLSTLLASNRRPNVMTVVDRLATMGCDQGWGLCDLSQQIDGGRMYWHIMLRYDSQ